MFLKFFITFVFSKYNFYANSYGFFKWRKKKETKSAFDKIKRKNWIFFFQNNVHFQTNLLVGNISNYLEN